MIIPTAKNDRKLEEGIIKENNIDITYRIVGMLLVLLSSSLSGEVVLKACRRLQLCNMKV